MTDDYPRFDIDVAPLEGDTLRARYPDAIAHNPYLELFNPDERMGTVFLPYNYVLPVLAEVANNSEAPPRNRENALDAICLVASVPFTGVEIDRLFRWDAQLTLGKIFRDDPIEGFAEKARRHLEAGKPGCDPTHPSLGALDQVKGPHDPELARRRNWFPLLAAG